MCRVDDGDWSNESSYICTWNLFRRALNPNQADLVIDVPTAVTALCCHPTQPALIAGTLMESDQQLRCKYLVEMFHEPQIRQTCFQIVSTLLLIITPEIVNGQFQRS